MNYINTETGDYPLTEEQVKAAFPNVSFETPFVPRAPYARVHPSEMPDCDPLTQHVVEEAPPLELESGYTQRWKVVNRSAEEVAVLFAQKLGALIQRIDSDVDAIYADKLGHRAIEYQKAESQARSYREAGYVGDIPTSVTSWAEATGNSAQWAADDIISTADAWRTAADMIRDVRLKSKEAARRAKTTIDLETSQHQWVAFVAKIRMQLNV